MMTNDDARSPIGRSADQTFLIGPNLYLRAVTPADAATGPLWNNASFPLPKEVLEQRIKHRLERGSYQELVNQLLLVCRRSDDRPVGSVLMDMGEFRYGIFICSVNLVLSINTQDQILAEMLDMLIPFSIEERNLMAVELRGMIERPLTHQTIMRHGGRVACRLREKLLVEGRYRDELRYQIFNPLWIEQQGEPPINDTGLSDIGKPFRAGITRPGRASDVPDTAFAVSERLYLRPFEPSDGELVAMYSRQETEIYFPEGRLVINPYAYYHQRIASARQEPPQEIRVAIVLRENQELVGSTGLINIDWVSRSAESATDIYRAHHRSAGIAFEAKQLVLDYVFDTLDMHMLYAHVNDTNPRSAAGIRKQGYRYAGYIAWEGFGPNGLSGAWMYDLLADEWREARKEGAKVR